MTYPNLHFALFGNVFQTKKNQFVAAVIQKLQDLGVKICVEHQFAAFINNELKIDLTGCDMFSSTSFSKPIDAAISIGGDGTFLGTAAQIGTSGIPIIGINTGRLGFLADVSPDNIDSALEALCQGDYVIEERKTLAVRKTTCFRTSTLMP